MTESYADNRLEEAEYHLSKATEGITALPGIFDRGVINALVGIGYGILAVVETIREIAREEREEK